MATSSSLQKQFGKKIRLLREALGYSREELAESADISPQNLAKIENGERFVRSRSLELIAKSLKVEVAELFLSDKTLLGGSQLSHKRIDVLLKNKPDKIVNLVADLTARILRDLD